jgi:ubiquinone/menaquinone biosynthesis C-methylase UbiE
MQDSRLSDTSYLKSNREAWNTLAENGAPLCQPASEKELADPLKQVDPLGWLGDSIRGQNVLCLAAGGGRHGALYSAAGANVTVVDLSPAMLDLDHQVASQRGYSVRTIEASMECLPMLNDGEFDLVVHPVSTCYVPDVGPVFAEVGRVLKGGGLYVSQHKQPASLQVSIEPTNSKGPVDTNAYSVKHTYYRDAPIPPPDHWSKSATRLRERGAVEYLHRWEQIIGGICRAGFVIEDLIEPVHTKPLAEPGSFADRARFVAPYMRIKARRVGATERPSIWLPSPPTSLI